MVDCLMQSANEPFVIAAAQAAPVFLDRSATVDRACDLIREAGKNGARLVVFPDGKWLVEPVLECEEILYAEVDPAAMKGPRFQLDVAGHYSRPDIFQLTVQRQARPMIRIEDEELPGGKNLNG